MCRSWAEEAEAKGWTAAARQHREHLARLEAMSKFAWHAQVDITMEIYTQASSKKTREALKRLSEMMEGEAQE